MDPNELWTHGAMWGMSPNLRIKLGKVTRVIWLVLDVRNRNEREREREERKRPRFSLRSTEIGWSDLVGPKFKAHLLGKGFAWASKVRSFDFVPDFGFSGSRRFLF